VEQIGIDPAALGRIEAASRDLKNLVTNDQIRAVGEVADKVEAAIEKVIGHLDELATFAGLDPEETRKVRQGLETVDGAADGIKAVLPAAIARGGAAGLAIAAGAGLLGGFVGANREEVRRAQRALELADQGQGEAFSRGLQNRLDELERQHEERRAAFRRARKVR
jgi:hypothetical protein